MHKIAAIGDDDCLLAYKAIGIEVFPVKDYREAHRLILKMANEDYGVIFLSESLSKEMEETLTRFREKLVPAIVLVPDALGTTGLGMAELKKSVEKAVGIDLFREKEGE